MPDLETLARQVNLIQKDIDNLKRIVRDLSSRPQQVRQQPQQSNANNQIVTPRPQQSDTTHQPRTLNVSAVPQKPPIQSVAPVSSVPVQKPAVVDLGIEGTFDGASMILADGTTLPVPLNYAAKSRLVFGDKLKMVEENGVKVFKQVQKVPRKQIFGILDMVDSKWYLLTEDASYAISSNAAEYNKAVPHSEAEAFIPEDNPNASFATLERVIPQDSNASPSAAPVSSTQPVQPSLHSVSPVAPEIPNNVPASSEVATIVTNSGEVTNSIAPQEVQQSTQPKKVLDPKVLYEEDLR